MSACIKSTYRVNGELKNIDEIMTTPIWIGFYPGLSEEMLSFVADKTRLRRS